jgi:hypothetical protein
MRYVIYKGEKNINDLAARVFRIQGKGSQAATRNAADTLLQENPQLSDLSKVPVGAPVAIPDDAPPVAPGEQAAGPGVLTSTTPQPVQDALDAMHQRLADIDSAATDRLNSAVERIRSSNLATALKNASTLNQVLKDRLPSMDGLTKDTKSVLKDAQAVQKLKEQSLSQLTAAVAALAKK